MEGCSFSCLLEIHNFLYIFFQTASHDPLLDDNIEFKKRLDKLQNFDCKLHVLNGLHHGFLNFSHFNDDCKRASQFVTQIIKLAFRF